MSISVNRRSFLGLSLAGMPLALGGCVSGPVMEPPVSPLAERRRAIDPAYYDMYAEIPDEAFPVPEVDLSEIDPMFYRRVVAYTGPEQPGTIVVDPARRFLFHVQDGGQAVRYGVGVGREGFGWSGVATVRRKAEWPTWTPPKEMVARDPKARPWANGMPGGLDNPLGARALYLYQGERDTLYRIHGTNEPWTIGTNVSSGCIRMINQDVINLHRNVPTGTKVVVLSSRVA